jgi:hypothetical protein
MGFVWLCCGQCHVHRTTRAATSTRVLIFCIWLWQLSPRRPCAEAATRVVALDQAVQPAAASESAAVAPAMSVVVHAVEHPSHAADGNNSARHASLTGACTVLAYVG